MRAACWTVVLGVGLVCCSAAHLAQGAEKDKPAPGAKAFEMRLLRIGDTYQGLRFNTATGESWQINLEKWEKVPETEAPAVGEYQITLIAGENGFLALRLERTTGATWLLKERKWNRIKEPAAQAKAAEPAAGTGYELRPIQVGGQLHVIRFHTGTGAAAHIDGTAYEALAEPGPLPAGTYDVTMMATKERWMAFRFDHASGGTWLLRANRWAKVAEPE
jgi:hypothetical protein